MLDFGVSHEQHERLRKLMTDNGVDEQDLEETYSYEEAHGGHNVNKVENCVHLLHRPTSTKVKYHKYKQQGLNRYGARLQMIEMLFKGRSQIYTEGFDNDDTPQTRKHDSKQHSEPRVDEKKHHSEIKKLRHTLREHELDLEELD